LICLAITLGLICLFAPLTLVEQIELRVLDWHARLRGPLPPPANISIVAIDETSLEIVGRWPWPRTRTAEIVQRLTEGGARVIALDLILREPDENNRLVLARSLAEQYRALGIGRSPGPAAEFGRVLEGALSDADTDDVLARALTANRRVVVPYFFIFGQHETTPLDDEAQRLLNRSRIVGFASGDAEKAFDPRQAAAVQLPLSRFIAASAANGHVNVKPDVDGALRHVELVIRLGDGLYPSLSLETARLALGLPRTRIRLAADRTVHLGSTVIPTDDSGSLLLSYYGEAGTFRYIKAVNVLTDSAPPAVKDHIVLVGFTAHGLMDVRPTPFDSVMPGVESHATAIANLLEGRGLRQLAGMDVVETIAVLLLALVGPLLLPSVGAIWGTVVALGLAAGTTGLVHLGFRSDTWILLLPPLVALAVGHVGSVTYQVLTEERERRWIKQAFRQYVPPAVVEQIGRDPTKLKFGGERRTLTVLFSDIRGFTTFSEHHTPEEVVGALQEYLTSLVEVVFRHRGTLDKFIGDATMAFFGAPFDNPNHALQACRAAVEMSDVVARLNERWKAEGREPFVTGFGIATGEMLVGNFGSSQRFAYTVIGDQVNLGARLESLNKDYETARHIIISQGTYELVRDHVVVRPLGSVTVKGKQKAVDIFDLVELKNRGEVGLRNPGQEASS
jgi:adenylate cyclase